jgi:hypothetical protein
VILTLLVAVVVDTMQTPDRRCRYTWHIGAPTSESGSPHTTKHPSVSSGHDKGTCWRRRFYHCPTDNSHGRTGDSWFTPSLTVSLGVRRRVGASACIQRSGARLPDWSYHTSSSGACRVPRRSSNWCPPCGHSVSASARAGLALPRTRREERLPVGPSAHPPGCSGGALPRALWHHSV